MLELLRDFICAVGAIVFDNHHFEIVVTGLGEFLLLFCFFEEQIDYDGQVVSLVVGWQNHRV